MGQNRAVSGKITGHVFHILKPDNLLFVSIKMGHDFLTPTAFHLCGPTFKHGPSKAHFFLSFFFFIYYFFFYLCK